MGDYFNDSNSIVIFVVGVLVTTIFLVAVWELMREGMTELPGALSTKIKKIKTNEID
jgi:hypothetical protein